MKLKLFQIENHVITITYPEIASVKANYRIGSNVLYLYGTVVANSTASISVAAVPPVEHFASLLSTHLENNGVNKCFFRS